MSIQSEITKSLKTGQVKQNNKAVKKQINAYNNATNDYIATQKQLTDDQNQQLTKSTEQSILGTRQQMQKQYDYNAINQQIQQDQIAERMADYGLSNSGLNFSQQTAVATQRMNADNSVMQQYNNAVNTLRSNLQNAIAENNRTLNSSIAGVQLDTQNKIAGIKANNATNNASIITNLKGNAKDLTNKLISSISSTNDKSKNAQSIFAYANTYGLSDKSLKRLLKMANISWGDYQKWIQNRDLFGSSSSGGSSSRSSGNKKKTKTGNGNGGGKGSKTEFENASKTIGLHFRGNVGDKVKAKGIDEWFDKNITSVYTNLSDKQIKTLRNRIAKQYSIQK